MFFFFDGYTLCQARHRGFGFVEFMELDDAQERHELSMDQSPNSSSCWHFLNI